MQPHASSGPPESAVKISVENSSGKAIPFFVDPLRKVVDLKAAVWGREGIPIDQQRLIFAGKQLEDGHTLVSCGITREVTVHLVTTLRG